MFCSGWLKMLFTGCATFRALLASSAFLGELPAVEAMLSEMCSSYSLVPLLLGPIFFWSGHLGRGNKFLGPVSLSHSCFTISIRCVDCYVAQFLLFCISIFERSPAACSSSALALHHFLAEHLRVFKNQARAGTVKPASPIIESKAKSALQTSLLTSLNAAPESLP